MMARYEHSQQGDAGEHPGGNGIQVPPQSSVQVSGGSITTKHMSQTMQARWAGKIWTSGLEGDWATQEIHYFEIVLELFRAGLLGGIEVGLPFRTFIANLLSADAHKVHRQKQFCWGGRILSMDSHVPASGCSSANPGRTCPEERVDTKTRGDQQIACVRCPAMPSRELTDFERRDLVDRLIRFEGEYLELLEVAPLKRSPSQDVRRNVRPRLPHNVPEAAHMAHSGTVPNETARGGNATTASTAAAAAAAAAAAVAAAETLQQKQQIMNVHQQQQNVQHTQHIAQRTLQQASAANTVIVQSSTALRTTAGHPHVGAHYPDDRASDFNAIAGTYGTNGAIRSPGPGTPTGREQIGAMGQANGSPMDSGPVGSGFRKPMSSRHLDSGCGSMRGMRTPHDVSSAYNDGVEMIPASTEGHTYPSHRPRPVGTAPGSQGGHRSQVRRSSGPWRTKDGFEASGMDNADAVSRNQHVVDVQSERHAYEDGSGHEHFINRGGGGVEAFGRNTLGLGQASRVPPPSRVARRNARRRGDRGGGPSNRGPNLDTEEAQQWAPVQDHSLEEVEAIEYLKWELHGKFMAFPGEDYQKLLSHLATEIYHFRYPVEHGIDVLQGVVRSGSLDALQVIERYRHSLRLSHVRIHSSFRARRACADLLHYSSPLEQTSRQRVIPHSVANIVLALAHGMPRRRRETL